MLSLMTTMNLHVESEQVIVIEPVGAPQPNPKTKRVITGNSEAQTYFETLENGFKLNRKVVRDKGKSQKQEGAYMPNTETNTRQKGRSPTTDSLDLCGPLQLQHPLVRTSNAKHLQAMHSPRQCCRWLAITAIDYPY